MKKKSFSFVMVLALALALMSLTAFAADNSKTDDSTELTLTINTDKESYKSGEAVDIDIVIKNDSIYSYQKLNYEISLPKELSVPEGTKTSGMFVVSAASSKTISLQTDKLSGSATTDSANEKNNNSSLIFIVIGCIAIVAIILVCFILKKKGKNTTGAALLLITLIEITSTSAIAAPSLDNFTLSASKEIEINGVAQNIEVTLTAENATISTESSNIGIHDPSVFQDPVSGNYYSYGSHIIAGTSSNLISWTYISQSSNGYSTTNQLFSKHYLEEFKDVYDWLGSDVIEGIWALDVTYSEKAAKAGNDPYLMYVTVVNGSFKSALCLATSDKPEGPFEYKGMIVCSDYRQSEVEAGHTNLLEVLGVDSVSEMTSTQKSFYFKADSNAYKSSLPDCIDAAPFYDKEGNLYLTYGSFTTKGGLRVLKLDAETGLRSDETYEYKTDGSQDPYYGKKIANANGEGPYILRVDTDESSTGSYYFLFWSQGNLRATGGYNMRMFRSEYPDHGYVDYAGQSALDNISATNLGIRIMDGFKFSNMVHPSTANGGNSAIVTNEGKIFVHYHSKSSNDAAYGKDGFIIKSNQMFLNEDGWLVTAPYKYFGESLEVIDKSDIVGDYEFIYHRLEYFKDPANSKDNYVSPTLLSLNEDGTVSGEYTGTWELNESNVTIKINDKTYKGVVLKQFDESTNRNETIVFTASGTDNRTIWGSKITASAEDRTLSDLKLLSVPSNATEDFELDTTGLMNSAITWSSDNGAIEINGSTAKVISQDTEQTVTLTATATFDSVSNTQTFTVTVPAEEFKIPSTLSTNSINLPQATSAGKAITWTSSDDSIINPSTGTVNVPSNTSVKVTLSGSVEGSDRLITAEVTVMPLPTNAIYTENYDSLATLNATSETGLWYSKNAAEAVTLQSDNNGGKYVQFAPGSANSRGAISTFDGVGQVDGIYVLDFDLALTAGDNQTTEFAATTESMAYLNNVINDGIASGYLFKFSAEANSTTWAVNGGDTFEVAKGQWIHVNALVDTESGTVTLTITSDNTEIYSETVAINGTGKLKGFYIRGGRYQSVTGVDNVSIKKN